MALINNTLIFTVLCLLAASIAHKFHDDKKDEFHMAHGKPAVHGGHHGSQFENGHFNHGGPHYSHEKPHPHHGGPHFSHEKPNFPHGGPHFGHEKPQLHHGDDPHISQKPHASHEIPAGLEGMHFGPGKPHFNHGRPHLNHGVPHFAGKLHPSQEGPSEEKPPVTEEIRPLQGETQTSQERPNSVPSETQSEIHESTHSSPMSNIDQVESNIAPTQERVKREADDSYIPSWTSCDFSASPKIYCHDCTNRLICKVVGGLVIQCPTARPYCNGGFCSTIPSDGC